MASSLGDTSAKCALLLLIIVSAGNALTCDYAHTFNITGSVGNPDGSVTFENMTFAADQFARFDYVLMGDGTKQTVASHTRACLDNSKLPCKYVDSINIENGSTNADRSITFEHITFNSGRFATFDYVLTKNEGGFLERRAAKPHIRGCLDNKLPCEYFESVDISAGSLSDDGSVKLGHMTFPPEQYGLISYQIKNGHITESVAPHRRGCVCNRQTCVRLCCKAGSLYVTGMGCVEHDAAAAANISMIIRTRDGELKRTRLADRFGYVSGKSCPEAYKLEQPYELNHVSRITKSSKYEVKDVISIFYLLNMLPARRATSQRQKTQSLGLLSYGDTQRNYSTAGNRGYHVLRKTCTRKIRLPSLW